MREFKGTPGPWLVGRPGSVASVAPLKGLRTATGHGDVKYYGGYLIGESIYRPEDSKLIAAAPDLLALVLEELTYLEWARLGNGSRANMIRAVLDKAGVV